jgi:hypothetical protein
MSFCRSFRPHKNAFIFGEFMLMHTLLRSALIVMISVLCATAAYAANGDTTRLDVIVKDRFPGTPTTLTSTVYVPSGKSWSRVLLKVKLECPCGKGLGEWDYTNTYYINVPTGRKDSTGKDIREPLEIARFITPYWGGQPGGTNYTWQWDITDYAFLLKDSTQFAIRYDGYTASAVFNVWVEAIEGTPPYYVYAIDNLWQRSFTYGNMKNPIYPYLTNKKFRGRDEAKFAKLRITNTGHGGYGPQVVAEFIDKTHRIALNGEDLFTQRLWREDCGDNPLYPQDGTWAYGRAGWCPGDVVTTWDWDITKHVTKGDSTRLDYKMEKFDVDSSCNGIYTISTQVMYATEPAFTNDVSLEEILAPNSDAPKTKYNRINPICGNPIVRIRNNGKERAKTVTFEYGVKGETPKTYTWEGDLGIMEYITVNLPAPDWTASFAASTRTFECKVVKTNGAADEDPMYNSLSSTYSVPPTYDSKIQINFKTNRQARGQGYFWEIRDADDNMIADRQNSTLDDQTTYVDSLDLKPGCYTFRFVNPSGVGLEWWATASQLGPAALSMSSHGTTVKRFPGDCGNGVQQQFVVGVIPQIKVVNDVSVIDFGEVAVGDSVRKTVSVTPLNSAGLSVSKVSVIALAKGFSMVSTDPPVPAGGKVSLKQGETMLVTVQYKPTVASRKSASLNIESNDPYDPILSIPMYGGQSATSVDDDNAFAANVRVMHGATASETRIVFTNHPLRAGTARCAIHNILGQEVRSVFERDVRAGGEIDVTENLSDLPSGAYFVVVRVGNNVLSAPLYLTR